VNELDNKSKKKVALVTFYQIYAEYLRTAASILKKDYDVTLLYLKELDNLQFHNPENRRGKKDLLYIVDFLSRFDYVLVSVPSNYEAEIFEMLGCIKKNGKTISIVGGQIAFDYPEKCLEHADYVCTYEGEGILELLKHIDSKSERKSIGNFICRKEDINAKKGFTRDLDTIPPPDFSIRSNYVAYRGKIRKVNKIKTWILYYETSKGCVFNCSFCFENYNNKIKKQSKIPTLRFKSPEKIISDLKIIKRDLPELRYIFFSDENFLFRSAEEIRQLLAEYDKHIRIPFFIFGDPRSPDFRRKAAAMQKSRYFSRISFGMQSGSEKFNTFVYNRPGKIEAAIRNIHLFEPKKVRVILMYGHPLETEESILSTLNMMLAIKNRSSFAFNHFIPLKNTPEGERYAKELDQTNVIMIHESQFLKFPRLYALMFYINFMKSRGLDFLLPRQIRASRSPFEWLFRFTPRLINSINRLKLLSWTISKQE
jgi:radical SAM superfamily enzyme YgiQ (UPF0313 family)